MYKSEGERDTVTEKSPVGQTQSVWRLGNKLRRALAGGNPRGQTHSNQETQA